MRSHGRKHWISSMPGGLGVGVEGVYGGPARAIHKMGIKEEWRADGRGRRVQRASPLVARQTEAHDTLIVKVLRHLGRRCRVSASIERCPLRFVHHDLILLIVLTRRSVRLIIHDSEWARVSRVQLAAPNTGQLWHSNHPPPGRNPDSPCKPVQAALELELPLVPHANVGKAKVDAARALLIPHERGRRHERAVQHLHDAITRVLDHHGVFPVHRLECQVAHQKRELVEAVVSGADAIVFSEPKRTHGMMSVSFESQQSS